MHTCIYDTGKERGPEFESESWHLEELETRMKVMQLCNYIIISKTKKIIKIV